MTNSPYSGLPASAFWRRAVSEGPPWETGLYRKRFDIERDTSVATAGSCFAQHIAKNMRKNGFSVLDLEPAPRGMTEASAKRFGYRLYSARYGNIYTARQLLQLALEALGRFEPADAIWTKDGRYFDAMRPNVEPEGLDSPEAVRIHRKAHLRMIERVLRGADLFVFTFGLTEAWVHRASGTVYPTAPGTVAGSYDPNLHAFKNFDFQEVYDDFLAFRALLKEINPKVAFLLTVSPVPLTATAADTHVLQATVYSKSVLRAVAGQLYARFDDIDYFPSYEIIGTPFTRRNFYEDNLREVSEEGVALAMRTFFEEHGGAPKAAPAVERVGRPAVVRQRPRRARQTAEDVVCEEVLLEAFAR